VECLCAPENLGFGGGCNLGDAHARNELVFLLNPDAVVLKGCLDVLADFLQATPRAGAVAPLIWWDMERTWRLPPYQLPTPASELTCAMALRWRWFGEAVSRQSRRLALRCLLSGQPVKQSMLSGGHVLLRRAAIEAVGGLFDPEYFMYYEDTDLCQRLRKAGFDLYLQPGAHAVHEWCATCGKAELSEKSRQLYFRKHHQGNLMIVWRESLEDRRRVVILPNSTDLGVLNSPPEISLSPELSSGWVAELSPSPLLAPAVYRIGSGPDFRLPKTLWERLGQGNYWLRISLGEGRSSQLYHWKVVQSD
jgi:GT2 family glycosyltransferase